MYHEIMKKLTALVFVVCLLAVLAVPFAMLVSPAGAADGSAACYNVPDADGRTACLAKARRDRSLCYSIQRPDMRALCLAEVK